MRAILTRLIGLSILLLCTGEILEAQVMSVPNSFHEREEAQEGAPEIVFFYYPYTGPDIRVAEVVQNYPNLEMPDTVTIIPPDLSDHENVYTFIGVIDPETSSPNELIIMLVGDYLTRRLTFFTDMDFDRDFTDEFEALTLRQGRPAEVVELQPWGESDNVFDLWLSVDRVQPDVLKKTRKIVQRVRNQFSISAQLGVSSGRLKYRYHNLDIGFPTWYHVNSTGRSLGLNIDYTYEFIRFGVGAAYQNLYYWTSYLKVRTGEPEVFVDKKTGERINIPNVTSYENRDLHSRNRIDINAKLSFLFPFGRLFDLQPFVKGGIITYNPESYKPNPSLEETAYKEGNDKYLEAGLQLDVTSGIAQSTYAGVSIHHLWWEPEGFFRRVNHTNLETSYYSIRFFAGYRFGL